MATEAPLGPLQPVRFSEGQARDYPGDDVCTGVPGFVGLISAADGRAELHLGATGEHAFGHDVAIVLAGGLSLVVSCVPRGCASDGAERMLALSKCQAGRFRFQELSPAGSRWRGAFRLDGQAMVGQWTPVPECQHEGCLEGVLATQAGAPQLA
jgi:hypothetical protein